MYRIQRRLCHAQHEQGFCQIDLGSPRRNSVIIYDGTEWRFSTKETDPDEEDALFQERISEGKMFLPEDVIKLQKEALCLVRCIDKRSFMVLIEGLPWEFGGTGPVSKSFIFEDIEEKSAIKKRNWPTLLMPKITSSVAPFKRSFIVNKNG